MTTAAEAMLVSPQRVEAALAAYTPIDVPALPGRHNRFRAGVLVPLRWGDNDLELILMLRPARMRHHAGEVCYPGGRPEPEDLDLFDTARREAHEELGIVVKRRLGQLSSMPLYTSDFRLVPFVAEIEDRPLVPHPGEVAEVLPVSVNALFERPHIDAIGYTWPGEDKPTLSPVFTLGEHVVYGGTAHSVLELLNVLSDVLERPVPRLETGRFTWEDLGLA